MDPQLSRCERASRYQRRRPPDHNAGSAVWTGRGMLCGVTELRDTARLAGSALVVTGVLAVVAALFAPWSWRAWPTNGHPGVELVVAIVALGPLASAGRAVVWWLAGRRGAPPRWVPTLAAALAGFGAGRLALLAASAGAAHAAGRCARDGVTGEGRWPYRRTGRPVAVAGVSADESTAVVLYAGDGNAIAVGLDVATGRERWIRRYTGVYPTGWRLLAAGN